MRAKAASLAPRDQGDLSDSITISEKRTRRARKEREPISGFQIAMGPASGDGVLNYAAFVEFGTVDTAPHPYMRPAYDSQAERAMQSIADNLGNEIAVSAQRRARGLARRKKA